VSDVDAASARLVCLLPSSSPLTGNHGVVLHIACTRSKAAGSGKLPQGARRDISLYRVSSASLNLTIPLSRRKSKSMRRSPNSSRLVSHWPRFPRVSMAVMTFHHRAVRKNLKDLEKGYEQSEDDIKAFQSVGQIVGEVLRMLDEERCEFHRHSLVLPRSSSPIAHQKSL
jgi:hypothetical protein